MQLSTSELISRAVGLLGTYHTVRHGERSFRLACLIRYEDTQVLRAPWRRGKDAYVVAVDVDGNFFLGHCDGSVRYWDHREQAEMMIARSLREFVAQIV